MRTDSSPSADSPIDPRIREALERRQFQPGPHVGTVTSQDVAAQTDAVWEALMAQSVDRAATMAMPRAGRLQTHVTVRRPWLMAAMVCLLVALGLGTWIRWSGPSYEGATQTFATKPGQRMTVRLADGSTILLAPATSVSVSGSSVDVSGAAYFTVAPHASKPLMVQTRNATVRVLGTRFEVRQFAGELMSRVVVEDGRVAVLSRLQPRGHDTSHDIPSDNRRNHAVASAGVLALVSDSGVTLTPGVATADLTGWVRGTLVFDRVPLRDVVTEVGRAYGASIRVADSALAVRPVLAEVDVMNLPLVRVLNLLCVTMSAHYVEDRGAFVLVPGRRARNEVMEKLQDRQFPQSERQYGR